MAEGKTEDPVSGIGNLWDKQDDQTAEFDFSRYNTKAWIAAKFGMAFCIVTAVYLLFGLRELPWTLFGSVVGILILVSAPFLSGLILGYTFENVKAALVCSLAVGFCAIPACFFLLRLPYDMQLAEYGTGFMPEVWYYGFFLPFLISITFVPAGAMVGASTNVQE